MKKQVGLFVVLMAAHSYTTDSIKVKYSRIAEKLNIQVKDAEATVNTQARSQDIVSDSLASGEPVRLSGFGTFDIRHVAAHQARTGEPVQVPATPTFRAGKTLKAKAASFNEADKKTEKRSLQKAEPPTARKSKKKKSAADTEIS